ncbi:hypothetical protein DESAMIL20_2044 [Desulfurella amilsii]|uniref:Uncharacterized protein n=1 Tax=Desulfurella amilsii TaxID=1562698 RepID=A0A1X4XU94_9BACT|nr:hypothetical protein DESAMIL20_2044 [Desulfurella amilsii]
MYNPTKKLIEKAAYARKEVITCIASQLLFRAGISGCIFSSNPAMERPNSIELIKSDEKRTINPLLFFINITWNSAIHRTKKTKEVKASVTGIWPAFCHL